MLRTEICLGQGTLVMRADSELLDAQFLLYILNAPFMHRQAADAAKGAIHPHVNLSDIRGFLVPMLSVPEQCRLSACLGAIDRKIEVMEHRKAALEALFKTLLRELMTGRVRVASHPAALSGE